MAIEKMDLIKNPATTPFSSASRMPFSTEEIYSLGITPPTILSTNTKPEPGESGTIFNSTSTTGMPAHSAGSHPRS